MGPVRRQAPAQSAAARQPNGGSRFASPLHVLIRHRCSVGGNDRRHFDAKVRPASPWATAMPLQSEARRCQSGRLAAASAVRWFPAIASDSEL